MEKERTFLKEIYGKSVCYDKTKDIIYHPCCTDKMTNSFDYQRVYTEEIYDTIYEITTKCNQRCENCFAECTEHTTEEMDYDFIYKDLLSKEKTRIRVAMTGGEPFLHPEIDKILRLPSLFPNIQFVINSNGNYVLSAKLRHLLIENDWLVTYSVHGGKTAHNQYTQSKSYDRILANIQALNNDVVIHIYSVLNQHMTRHDIDEIIKLLDTYNIDFVRFILLRSFGRVDGNYDTSNVEYIRAKNKDNIGIKSDKSLSELINVNKISRLAR